jgi:DNA-binding transcriptional MerR regulator
MTKEQKEVVRVWERFKSLGISLSDIEEAVELWKKNANKNV